MLKYIFPFFVLFVNVGLSQNKRIEILIQKEIKNTFGIESYSNTPIQIEKEVLDELPTKFSAINFFKINKQKEIIGYYYIGKAFGKTDYFDFMVVFNKELNIVRVKVLVYREERGGEVASTRWLKQFNGQSYRNTVIYQKDIAAISGATISAKSITNQINMLLQSMGILHSKKIL